MRTTLTMLIHGGPGAGKSRLTNTMPTPRLILDAEGRAKHLPGKKVWWDPMRDAPPEIGDWETCVAIVPNTNVLLQAFSWLGSGQHPFKSVGCDSLMEIQKRTIDETVGMSALQFQDWGTLLRRLEHLVRQYRDLTLSPATGVEVVVFTVGTTERDGKYVPLLQGQLRDTVPYYFDVVGYLYATSDAETSVVNRNLLIQPIGNFIAKDGTDKLTMAYGPVIMSPNIQSMVDTMREMNGNGSIVNTEQEQEAGDE